MEIQNFQNIVPLYHLQSGFPLFITEIVHQNFYLFSKFVLLTEMEIFGI